MVKQTKTNAVRMLDRARVPYELLTYDYDDGQIDGRSVAKKIGQREEIVYKTLVTKGTSGQLYVFVIPVAAELDLKKAANVVGEKSVHMLPVADIEKMTGYVRGGCSPIGMKKLYATYVDESALAHEQIIVSAGKIGMQMKLPVQDLLKLTNGKTAHVIKE
ncbi:Cys-tRNA(Pro) deacylase [Anoxybacillus kestanbolensis]|uniref:Cys-tRNA(Pro) deacylase n=1 Tax=Anoxybacillus kestanbolensis TaxID=227476 RepID=UPI003D1D2614